MFKWLSLKYLTLSSHVYNIISGYAKVAGTIVCVRPLDHSIKIDYSAYIQSHEFQTTLKIASRIAGIK